MNFALPTLIVVFVLLAGFVHRLAYNGEMARDGAPNVPQNFSAFSLETIWVVTAACGIHATLLTAAWFSQRYYVDVKTLLYLLAGNYRDSGAFERASLSVAERSGAIAMYFVASLVTGGVSGYLIRYVIRSRALDQRFAFLRFNNPWHYLLNGELPTPKDGVAARELDGIAVTAIMEQGDSAFLYCGFLADWHLDSSGNLERIVLRKVVRRKLSDDKPGGESKQFWEDSRYYAIAGDFFVLKYLDVKDLNVLYVYLDEVPTTAEPATTSAVG